MAFTTQTFIFLFFPLSILFYYLSLYIQKRLNKTRLSDVVLIVISLLFYSWACAFDALRFVIYIFIVYILGKSIELNCKRNANNKTQKTAIIFSVIVVVMVLIYFKYTDFLISIYNSIAKKEVEISSIVAPLGISFITFSAISYLVDIYREKATCGNIIDCALYLTFFPKVVSGPIVLWKDFEIRMHNNKISINKIYNGVTRIMIGFVKKVVLADTFGMFVQKASGEIDITTSWLVALAYMLQIYYDFAGYSDTAIGLANMLGFEFEENFNFPYLSKSITEFWRRWHISLGMWFREYIYIPLGGNRKGEMRTIINVAIVFLITGIWHGAGITYILWGILNGLCNIIEKLVMHKSWYLKIPGFVKWAFTMLIIFCSWILFRFDDFVSFKSWVCVMIGRNTFDNIPYTWRYYLDNRLLVFMVVGILGSTVLGLDSFRDKLKDFIDKPFGNLVYNLSLLMLFAMAVIFMVSSTYSPFIYFQY